MIVHHDRLKPYNSDVVPVWVQRLWRQVLQSCQDSAKMSPEVDSLTVPEPPRPEDTSEDTTDDREPLRSCDHGNPPSMELKGVGWKKNQQPETVWEVW